MAGTGVCLACCRVADFAPGPADANPEWSGMARSRPRLGRAPGPARPLLRPAGLRLLPHLAPGRPGPLLRRHARLLLPGGAHRRQPLRPATRPRLGSAPGTDPRQGDRLLSPGNDWRPRPILAYHPTLH